MRKMDLEPVEHLYCDRCGVEIESRYSAWFCMHSGGDVMYEWSVDGDYCEKCGKLLGGAVVESFAMPDRYNRLEHDEAIANELEMIERYREQMDGM